jgi:hypothetical protein
MGHEHLAGSLVKLMQNSEPTSRSNDFFHPSPEAFNGIKVVATVGRWEMQFEFILIQIVRF